MLTKRSIVIATIIGLLGYGLGKHQKQETLENITDIFINEKITNWRNIKINTNKKGRPFVYVNVFPTTNLGAIGYVFATLENKQTYILLTRQNRNVNGIKTSVFEPPAGFLNPPYNDQTPHCVVEFAERKIDLWQRDHRNKNASRETRRIIIEKFYLEAWHQYKQGNLDENYIVDKNLVATAKREIHEETGIDLNILNQANSYLFNEELNKNGTYLARYLFQIDNINQLPNLMINNHTNEVENAQWINLKDIEFEWKDKKIVAAKINKTPIKPYDKHPQMLHLAILKEKKLRERSPEKLTQNLTDNSCYGYPE